MSRSAPPEIEPPGSAVTLQRPARPSRRRRRRRIRRAIGVVVLILLVPVLYSYVSYMVEPSNSGFFAQSVEWLRTHGGRWLVNDVENIYYSLNAPSKGGPALKRLPSVGFGASSSSAYSPPPIAPAIQPALPGEGTWRKASAAVAGAPAVLDTSFRPDPSYPRLVAGVAWVDASRTQLALYPGRYEPPSMPSRGTIAVPPAARSKLIATFNSGFKLEDSAGGFVSEGHQYAPLVDGKATLLAYRSGRIDVRTWTGGTTAPPDVVVARQNLPLIVDGGRPSPNLSDGPEWGATLGNKVRVWRSGIGVDARGDLLYAAADQQTVASLAQILQRAGAVRAMELDINYEWVSFNTYQWLGANPSKLLPGMDRAPTRYLTPDDRDFFAVFARQPAASGGARR